MKNFIFMISALTVASVVSAQPAPPPPTQGPPVVGDDTKPHPRLKKPANPPPPRANPPPPRGNPPPPPAGDEPAPTPTSHDGP